MRLVVAGLGVQGRKRLSIAGDSVIATVDPADPSATYASIEQVPVRDFDGAMLCVPDAVKPELLEHLVQAGKHVLVEKPLVPPGTLDLAALERGARGRGITVYAAYNHRFEPHLARAASLLRARAVGTPYRVAMFYGNGTARDVRGSPWRDDGPGVIGDLLPHLLDILDFTTGRPEGPFSLWSASRHENAACDHFLAGFPAADPVVTLEGSLLAWRNRFSMEVIGSTGSLRIDGLCKWGPSTLTVRRRILPSGKPPEKRVVIEQPDPTWRLEHKHFLELCGRRETSLERDRWVDGILREIAVAA